jgi:two-component system nitrogen regulation response regulator NtrX
VETFLMEFAQQAKSKPKKMSQEALDCLLAYHWPGNVRELRNLIERLSIMGGSKEIEASDLPATYNPSKAEKGLESEKRLFEFGKLKEASKAFEGAFIQRKLTEYDNDVSKAAEAIGLSAETMRKKLKQIKETS